MRFGAEPAAANIQAVFAYFAFFLSLIHTRIRTQMTSVTDADTFSLTVAKSWME